MHLLSVPLCQSPGIDASAASTNKFVIGTFDHLNIQEENNDGLMQVCAFTQYMHALATQNLSWQIKHCV